MASACSTHGTPAGSTFFTEAGVIAIENILVPPDSPAECLAGIGLGSTANPLPRELRAEGIGITIRNTATGVRRVFEAFAFSANPSTTRGFAAGSGLQGLPHTNPLIPGATWFGFSSRVQPFLLPEFGARCSS